MMDRVRSPSTAIKVRAVSKSFGDGVTAALRDISFDINRCDFVVVLGPSGCGKTTLLRLMGGLIDPDHGELSIDGTAPQPGPDIGMVFQSCRLVPWMTVGQNVNFALGPMRLGKADRRERVQAVLGRVGLSRFHAAYPHMLSGGMMQRVALARALVCKPSILLMDEPFAALDAQTRELMQTELRKLTDSHGVTTVFVTHSVDEALILGDQVVVLSPRPGRVVEQIPIHFRHAIAGQDPRDLPGFNETRRYLANRLKDLVLNDPGSDFYEPARSNSGASVTTLNAMSVARTNPEHRGVVAFTKH